jgi:ketosteroid isomerase-like protein
MDHHEDNDHNGDNGELADFGRRWADAERRGDVSALDALLTDDFTAVGPRGFVLGKEQWLDRYASGALVHDDFTWNDVTLRQYGGTAVAVGVQGQQSVYDGRDADGRFRITQTLVEVEGQWRLAAVHLSETGAPGR